MLRSVLASLVAVVFAFSAFADVKVEKKPDPADKKEAAEGEVKGKVKSVDAEKNTITITTADGKDVTFEVTKESKLLGRDGKAIELSDKIWTRPVPVIVIPTEKGGMKIKELKMDALRRLQPNNLNKIQIELQPGGKIQIVPVPAKPVEDK